MAAGRFAARGGVVRRDRDERQAVPRSDQPQRARVRRRLPSPRHRNRAESITGRLVRRTLRLQPKAGTGHQAAGWRTPRALDRGRETWEDRGFRNTYWWRGGARSRGREGLGDDQAPERRLVAPTDDPLGAAVCTPALLADRSRLHRLAGLHPHQDLRRGSAGRFLRVAAAARAGDLPGSSRDRGVFRGLLPHRRGVCRGDDSARDALHGPPDPRRAGDRPRRPRLPHRGEASRPAWRVGGGVQLNDRVNPLDADPGGGKGTDGAGDGARPRDPDEPPAAVRAVERAARGGGLLPARRRSWGRLFRPFPARAGTAHGRDRRRGGPRSADRSVDGDGQIGRCRADRGRLPGR